jgi:hypothetical protein
VSISATVTPAPVEYCQAWGTLSIALPGAGWPRSGSAITTGFTHATFWRISSVGPGGPSGGKAPGSITGGARAAAAGAEHTWAASNAAAANAEASRRARISGT